MGQFIKRLDSVVLSILLVSITVVSIWFKNGYLFQGAEEGSPFYYLQRTNQLFSTTWIDQYLGSPFLPDTTKIPIFNILAYLQTWGVPAFFIQAFLFIFLLSAGGISVYYLLKTAFKINALFAGLGAFFYICNPYSISEIWSRGLYHQFFAYFLVPFFLLMFISFYEYKKSVYLLLGVIISYFFSAAMGNPAYIITLWFPILCYFCLNLFKATFREKLFLTYGLLVYLGLWFFVNLWWLGVVVPFSASAYTGSGSVFENSADSLKAISAQLPFVNIIRLFHEIRFGKDFYGEFYNNSFMYLLSFVYPLIIILSLVKIRQKNFGFFLILFIAGLIVSLGSNPPFGKLFLFFFNNIPPLQVFRNPYEKFGLVYLLGFTGLFTLGIRNIWEYSTKKLINLKIKFGIFVLIFISIFFFCLPFWTGEIIGWGTATRVPDYYRELNNWFNLSDHNDQKVFFLPFMPDFGAQYKWYGNSYHGTDPLFQIFDKPILSQSGHSAYLNALKRYQGSMDLTAALAIIRVKYLVERNDLVSSGHEDKQNMAFTTSYFATNKFQEGDLCEKKYLKTITTGIECEFYDSFKDLSDVKYIHLLMSTSKNEAFDLSITDNFEKTTKWTEKSLFFDFRNEVLSDQKWVTFYLNDPSEYSKTNLKQIKKIKVDFHNSDLSNLKRIEVSKIVSDVGEEKSISGVKYIDKIATMSVYEIINPLPLLEINSVNKIIKVNSFIELFQLAGNYPISSTSFIIPSQNFDKEILPDLNYPVNFTFTKKDDLLYKIESPSQQNYIVQLNTSYNPEWKIVPIENIDLTDGSFLHNLKLLWSGYIPEKDHYVSNGYANLWNIKGYTKVALIYRPQIVLKVLDPISKVILGILLITMIVFYTYKFYSRFILNKSKIEI